MPRPLSISVVSQGGPSPELHDCRIDFPRSGLSLDGDTLEVVGWAVGRDLAVARVELAEAGREVARAPMIVDRPDIATRYAGSPQGDRVSFHLVWPNLDPGRHELVVRAVLPDRRAAEIGRIACKYGPPAPRPGAVILTYHRVVSLPFEPWTLSVSPSHFDEQMEALRGIADPWPLSRLVAAIRRKDAIPPRTIVVTFDDGYSDNLSNALPPLERHEIPATLFVTTGFVGQPREFWWDELDRIFLQATSLPSELSLEIDGRERRWSLEGETAWDETAAAAHAEWRAGSGSYPTARHRIYRELWEILLDLPGSERVAVQDALLSWASLDSRARPTHRSMTLDELLHMSRSDFVEIGAHTVTHPNLHALRVDEQHVEARGSKDFLEELLDRPVTGFAYPFGQREHYSQESMNMLEDAGFLYAVANHPGLVTTSSHTFALPRRIAPDLDGDAFARKLQHWFSAGDPAPDQRGIA